MPYEEIPQPSYSADVPSDGVTISTRPSPRGGGSFVVFAIGRQLSFKLGFTDCETVKILWGTGPDKGKAQIQPLLNGKLGWKIRHSKTRSSVSTAALPLDRNKAAAYKHKVIEHEAIKETRSLVLYLPRDFFAESQP